MRVVGKLPTGTFAIGLVFYSVGDREVVSPLPELRTASIPFENRVLIIGPRRSREIDAEWRSSIPPNRQRVH